MLGALHVSVSDPSPFVTASDVGAAAGAYGLTAADSVDHELVPFAFVAETRNV